jgi:hypothetical protein
MARPLDAPPSAAGEGTNQNVGSRKCDGINRENGKDGYQLFQALSVQTF